MGVSVSVEADRDRIMRAFHANDVKIEEMMGRLDAALEVLGGDRVLSDEEKYRVVQGAEYLLVRLRSLLLRELVGCGSALSGGSVSAMVTKLFRDRRQDVMVLCGRLNELREDFQAIQRTVWTGKAGGFGY